MSSNSVIRVWEVLHANDTARMAYERVLARPTRKDVAKNVICLLLWLETIMGVEVLRDVAAMASGDVMLSRVITEAYAVHSCLLHGHYWLPERLEGIPTIVGLCGGGRLVDFRFFKFHRDLIARGLVAIRYSVAPLVFNDGLHAMLRRYEAEVDSLLPTTPAPALMAPFVTLTSTPPEDFQTAFVAFADGHPLSAQDISNYFEQRLGFGRCIERVSMELPRAGQTPKHGIIVFRSADLRDQAMFRETAAFFRVNGHDMWVQLYMPLC